MKKLISKFFQWTCVLGTLSIPVLAHADDQALIQGQWLSEVQITERDLIDSLGNHGQKYTVQHQGVVQTDQTVFQILPCAQERLELKECEESQDENKDCTVYALILIRCEDENVLEAMSRKKPHQAHTE